MDGCEGMKEGGGRLVSRSVKVGEGVGMGRGEGVRGVADQLALYNPGVR